MTLLALDTSGPHCAAALLRDGRLTTRSEAMTRGQADRLMPLLEDLLSEAAITWQDLSAIGVGIGPGNFTGIRISVAAARGLALALDIPAIGVSALEALAHGQPGAVRTGVDARRDLVYVQSFENGIARDAPELLARDAAGALIEGAADIAAIAQIAASRIGGPHEAPAPLYIRSADAALPSEPPPRIVP